MKRLVFAYDMKDEAKWMDGIWAAIKELEKDFDIWRWNLQSDAPPLKDADFILGWGGFHSPVDFLLQNEKEIWKNTKMGLCIAGNAFPPDGALKYDVLFYETKWYRPQINFHPNIVQAFGVNTDIYFPIKDIALPQVWDYLGVGAFAKWKRWEKMKDKKGMRLVIGEYQLGNETESNEIVTDLIKNGVVVSGFMAPFDLSNMYQWARTVYIPADIYGGGERAVLEARSCGRMVEIEDDNPKLKELLTCPIPSHVDYAKKLKQGILSVL